MLTLEVEWKLLEIRGVSQLADNEAGNCDVSRAGHPLLKK